MSYIKDNYKCPNCQSKIKIKIYDEVNDDAIESIITRDFFKVTCNKCNNSIYIDYPFNVNCKKYYIYYTPTKRDYKKIIDNKISRVCDTYDDLKEKILILEDDLNDILVEFIKYFIKNQLEIDDLRDLKDIRYDSKNEENLIFTLIGCNKNVAIPIVFYDNVYKRSKFKKSKKAIIIDQESFHKYYKLV